ncbi:hypothetical protein LSTR_LSTR015889 [Laodelphax striatellus]|uniref:Zasp-like motif domain-containing protein n=1 Tax=Laodelphax striatellus TaxID=195883 RepID=A0A482XRA8_LAOST|nr:hypothetical protein LSTR_LSTR015889 [Laodelphax striatellus]
MEGSPSPQHSAHAPQFNYQQQQQQQQQPQQQSHHQLQQRRPVYVHNKNNPQYANAANENSAVDGRSPQGWVGQPDDSAPVQSRSFKVLQKVTDAYSPSEDMPYNSQGVPLSQLRKLQLSDDDRALMNKVKTQVDEEQFLHNESDPRYRGASIPSRAFRMLQNMTDHPGDYMTQVPQGSGSPSVLSNRRPQPQEPTPLQPPQPYIPPSEQQVQEPRKYQGGAIPSRSFRILQAMTAGSNPSVRNFHNLIAMLN